MGMVAEPPRYEWIPTGMKLARIRIEEIDRCLSDIRRQHELVTTHIEELEAERRQLVEEMEAQWPESSTGSTAS